MGKGHYFGGGTLIGPRSRIGRGPLRGGSGSKAAAEARRVAKKAKEAEQKKRIAKNERLVKKLAKLWQEERGKAHFQRLAQNGRLARRTPKVSSRGGSALAQALRASGLVGDQRTGDE